MEECASGASEVFERVVRVGCEVSLQIARGPFAGTYPCRVEEVTCGGVTLTGPTFQKQPVLPIPGTQVVIHASAQGGVYEFKAKVREAVPGPPHRLVLERLSPEPSEYFQRREQDRVPARIGVRYQVLSAPSGSPGSEEQFRGTADTADLSGTGVCLLLSQRLSLGTLVDLYIPLEQDSEPIYAQGEVVRVGDPIPNEGTTQYETAFRFVLIRFADQERIAEFLRQRQ